MLDHLAQRQGAARQARPLAAQRDVEKGPHDAAGALADIDHVRGEGEPFELEARDVGLQQDVGLGRRLVDVLLDRDGHALDEARELLLLLLAHGDVGEVGRQREEAEQRHVCH